MKQFLWDIGTADCQTARNRDLCDSRRYARLDDGVGDGARAGHGSRTEPWCRTRSRLVPPLYSFPRVI